MDLRLRSNAAPTQNPQPQRPADFSDGLSNRFCRLVVGNLFLNVTWEAASAGFCAGCGW